MKTYGDDCCSYGSDTGDMEIETLIRSSYSWDMNLLPNYGPGIPEITILKIKIPPGGRIPLHRHPVISGGVVIKGQATVIAGNQKTTFKPGDGIIECVDKWHHAVGAENESTEIIIFHAGIKGIPTTIPATSDAGSISDDRKLLEDRHLSHLDGFQYLHETMNQWGISLTAGVTGGGVIHLVKYFEPATPAVQKEGKLRGNSLLTIGEYVAGFVPLGYFLATGEVAGAVATTGAATKLLTCGMSDAKLHNIPALYIVPISDPSLSGFGPLQDTSSHGLNIVSQLLAELPDSTHILDGGQDMPEILHRTREILASNRPAALVLDAEKLKKKCPFPLFREPKPEDKTTAPAFCQDLDRLAGQVNGRKVILLVCSEMARHRNAHSLTNRLSNALGAATIYSINGASAVSRENPLCYGYISFGGNKLARSLWESMNEEHILIVLGNDFDEYTTGTAPVSCAECWIFSQSTTGYGPVNGSYGHRFTGECHHIGGDIETNIEYFLQRIQHTSPRTIRYPQAPADLNLNEPVHKAREGCVDLHNFYKSIDTLWREESLGFDDVCMSYKDRQFVTQRPNNHCHFYSLYRGSAMGGAFGLAVGAQIGQPGKTVFVFTGDGCFRLIGGSMAEVSDLGINMFVLDNRCYGIVQHGLTKILPGVPRERFHSELRPLDYRAIARGFNWDYEEINPDLSNLTEILDRCYAPDRKSLLIRMSIDPLQDLGQNPRLARLA